MFCPVCRTQYAFFEKKCSRCDADLVEHLDQPAGMFQTADPPERRYPEVTLVSVFKTDDRGVLPLATMALEGEGIEYFVKNAGKVDSMQWAMSQEPTVRPVVREIFVSSEEAARARDLLVDLERPGSAVAAPDAALESPTAADPPSVKLEDAVTGVALGSITESQLQEITSRLEEESPQQYFITGATVDMLQEAGVDGSLVQLLRDAVGAGGSGLVIRWVVR